MKPFDPFAEKTNATPSEDVAPFDPFAKKNDKPHAEKAVACATPFSPFMTATDISPAPVHFDEPVKTDVQIAQVATPAKPVFAYQPEIAKADPVKPATIVDNAFNAFENGAQSVKEQARDIILQYMGPDCEREAWFLFLWGWCTNICRDGERFMTAWLKDAGAKNQQAHDRVTDLHQDHDRLNALTSIENAHKLIAGTPDKKWFQRNKAEPEQVEAHLSVIQQATPTLKLRVAELLVLSRQLMLETGAISQLGQRAQSDGRLACLHEVTERVYLLNQSAALLVPDLLLLERELQQQGEDVETLVTITLPLWRRKQKRNHP